MDPRGHLLGNRYRLQSVLASGGMGRVWRAHDTLLQRPVAVKILRSEFTGDPAFLGRFRAEAQHAAQPNDPCIAAVHDYGESQDPGSGEPLAYLVMELVDGEPLSDLLARSAPLDVLVALRIVRQTAAALAAAHAAGVVHRDVKPGNVLVRPDGGVKITDFGIAWSASSVPLTRTGQVMGTAHYLSPEQAQGAKALPASDVYALGVVAYECLAGRRPFEGESSVQVALKQISEEPPPLPADIPQDVRRLVERAMAKNPAARFADGAAMRDAVDEVLTAGNPPVTRDETRVLAGAALPRTAILPAQGGVASPLVGTPTNVRPSAGAAPSGARRPWALLAGVAIAVVLVVVALAGVGALGGDPDGTPGAGTTTAPSTSTAQATPTAVDVRSADLVGRPLADVEAQLTAAGLQVQPRPIATGDVPDGQVIAVDPVGEVAVGGTVTVTYAVAPPTQSGDGNGNGEGNGNEGNGNEGNGNGHEGNGNGHEGNGNGEGDGNGNGGRDGDD
jgi:hypothetical protein